MLEDPADSDGEYLDAIQWEMIRLFIGCTVIVLGLVLLISDMGTWSREDRKAAQALQRLNERQKTLEAINRQTQKLVHHQRLETIGTLTASISHEFNNLLTPIMRYSLMTLEKLPPEEEELAGNLIAIINASEKAKMIISRLPDLSRKSWPHSLRLVSVDELIKRHWTLPYPQSRNRWR